MSDTPIPPTNGDDAGDAADDPSLSVQPVALQDEMERSFLDYAMSVIMSRALPDVRDGLKPVHRRIIWDMEEQGFRPDRPFVKSARVTGDTMARYHPHGDSAIYDSLVRMAQPFSLRHPLIDFHGNYGSPDFGPAAARYTECRLHPLAMQLLSDIDEETVDMQPTYDGSREEPTVLPSRFPNLLVNGSQGIAVGMATNIPPHNLGEVIDAALHLLAHPEATADDAHAVRQGPRLPHGRQHPRASRHHRRLPHRSWQHQDARQGSHRRRQARPDADRGHRVAVPDQLLGDRRAHPRAGRRWRSRRASPTSTTARPAARPAWSSRSSATPTPTWCSTTCSSSRSCRPASASTWSPSSTACHAHSTSSQRCRVTCATRSMSSPAARSTVSTRPASASTSSTVASRHSMSSIRSSPSSAAARIRRRPRSG